MVRVSVSETYDLSTKTGKMSLIGIHTPNIEIVRKAYGGLLSNVKFIRFHHCDVRLACASVLPADPLQVGVEAGDIAPQDMFNPILYKAVSNQAMNEFELRMHGTISDDANSPSPPFHGQSIVKTDEVTSASDEFAVYYSLLANRKGWRVAHPQRGLHMKGLRPFVYDRLYSEGDSATSNDNGDYLLDINYKTNAGPSLHQTTIRSLRGRPRPLPALPAHTLIPSNVSVNRTPAYSSASVLDQVPDVKELSIYCGLIVMPPAKLNQFFYRLVVRWYIDLLGVRPYNEIETFGGQTSNASVHYNSDYFPIGSKENQLGMVDVSDGNIEKIMEGR